MLVGIYIPSRKILEGNSLITDRLENEFLLRAIRGILSSSTNTDTNFLWLMDKTDDWVVTDIPMKRIHHRTSWFDLARGNTPTLDQTLAAHHVDVLLTRVDTYPLPKSIPKVLFALDMLFHDDAARNPSATPQSLPRKIKKSCVEAKIILCPSQYVNKACASRLDMGLEKAVVAPPGVDPIFSHHQESIIDGPFALYVLNRYSRSGIPTLLNAIQKHKELFPPTLVVLGSMQPNEPEDWLLSTVRIEQCPDAMTASLMQNAQMCIYLSKGDGSGMTVMQAMTAGAMLVTTKSGANFEVGGSAPFYCEPDNAYSLLQVLRRMLDESQKERAKRRQTARSLVMDHTWTRCGNKVLSALKRSLL